MPDPAKNHPGPGRSTQNDAFAQVAKEIAQRNEKAHKAAREIRAEREQAETVKKRQREMW